MTREIFWEGNFFIDPGVTEARIAPLLQRVGTLKKKASSFLYVIYNQLTAEARAAHWKKSCVLLQQEEVARLLFLDRPLKERFESLHAALRSPKETSWHQIYMLLTTWPEDSLDDAVSQAKVALDAWPDRLRLEMTSWTKQKSPLAKLCRYNTLSKKSKVSAEDTYLQVSELSELASVSGRRMLECQEALEALKTLPSIESAVSIEGLALNFISEDGKRFPALKPLLESKRLSSLRALCLEEYKVSADDLRALAEGEHPLEYLRLQNALLKGEQAGLLLAKLAEKKPLRCLELKYNGLEIKGATALFADANARFKELTALDLSANEIGDKGVAALASCPTLGNLRWLNLEANVDKNELTEKACLSLANAVALDHLTSLNLSKNPLSAKGIAALLTSKKLPRLEALSMCVVDASLGEIIRACGDAETIPLRRLELTHRNSEEEPLDLTRARFLQKVEFLHIGSLEDEEFESLFTCPHLGRLETLIIDVGAQKLIKAKEMLCTKTIPSVRQLCLDGCEWPEAFTREFCAGPLAKQLSVCWVDDVSAKIAAIFFENNIRIQCLYAHMTPFSTSAVKGEHEEWQLFMDDDSPLRI
jgi:hypothetical protein